MDLLEATEKFKDAIADEGLTPPFKIIPNGKIQRYRANRDKAGSKNGWYVFFDGDLPAGAAGNWKTGDSIKWCGKSTATLSAAEKVAYKKRMDEAKRQREAEIQKGHKKARAEANKQWQDAKPATADHPYLINKGISLHGVRVGKNNRLLVPVRNSAGKLQSLQFIAPDGDKLFLPGGAIQGHYFSIGKLNNTLLICEGFATGATLHEATSHAVAVAFNAGNLQPVASAIKNKFPKLKIIICGDNDMNTAGNPGVTKATAAAKSTGSYLAVPQFNDTEGNHSDFNDLASVEGVTAVREQVENAKPVEVAVESPAELVEKLANLSTLEYAQQRKQVAKQLDIPLAMLDKIVSEQQKPLEKAAELVTESEPWPEPVDGLQLYNVINSNLTKHIILPEGAATTISLWIMLTYCFDAFYILPILTVWSPEKRCGKTTLLGLLKGLVNNGLLASNISPAAVYRVVEKLKPTLLTDEADTFLKANEELRGIFNSGHTLDGAKVLKVNKETMEVEEFSTWSPKAIAMIGKPADTILDRSVVVKMNRKAPGEITEKKNITFYVDAEPIRRQAIRFAADNLEILKSIEPEVPDLGNDRMMDNWTPLLSIAAAIDDEILEKAKHAMKVLSDEQDGDSIGVMLLEDIKAIFKKEDTDRLSSERIVSVLVDMEDRPWPEWGKGNKGITKTALAKQLKKYGVKSKNIRIGDSVPKGYELNDFTDCFNRYLPSHPTPNATTLHANNNSELRQFQTATQKSSVADKNEAKCLKSNECSGVADENPYTGVDGTSSDEEIEL